MKVLNLCCSRDHRFEGWFGSEDDFQKQLAQGVVACPVCEDTAVQKRPSAPRIQRSARAQATAESLSERAQQAGAQTGSPTSDRGRAEQAWLEHMRRVMARTVDVGEAFPEEARKMHYGEAPERAIRGQATVAEAQALQDEGIEVVALPVPAALKSDLQ